MKSCPPSNEPQDSIIYCRILDRNITADAGRVAATIQYPECGAIVTFSGNVRLQEDGRELLGLRYEHHETMAERELKKILREALERFNIRQVACEHSTGLIQVQQASVAVAVGADHREGAFLACQFIMERLKQTVPIWKHPVFRHDSKDQEAGE